MLQSSPSRESYQQEISDFYKHEEYSSERKFGLRYELNSLILSATKESCSNLIFALQINAKDRYSSVRYHDEHLTALKKLKDITQNIDEVTKSALGIKGSCQISTLFRIFSKEGETKQHKKLIHEQKVLVSQILHNCMIQCPSTIDAFLERSLERRYHSSDNFWDCRKSLKRLEIIHTFEPIPFLSEVIALLESHAVEMWKKKFTKSSFVFEDKRHGKKDSNVNDVDAKAIETTLRHQPEYWHTARRFYAQVGSDDNDTEYNRNDSEDGSEKKEYWDVFTRDNILRVNHATDPIYYDGTPSYTHNEKVVVFTSSNECDAEASTMCSSLVSKRDCEEMTSFGEKYKQKSKLYWTWVVGSKSDLQGLSAYSSKIGGAPAVYLDLARQWDFYQEEDIGTSSGTFMFQIDLSTIPLKLQEKLGKSGLLQFFDFGGDDVASISKRLVPEKDFPLLVKGRDENKNPEAPIVGWNEKYDFVSHSEPIEKFGGYFIDVQGGYDDGLVPDKNLHFIFEIRSCSNIFDLNLGDYGNLQYFGCLDVNNGWDRINFRCH